MRIEYDPILIEQAVFLKARRNPRFEGELHAAIDPLYASPPGYSRESRYQETYKKYFRILDLDGIVPELLAERCIIEERVRRCLVRRAAGVKDGGAELYVRPNGDDGEAPERTVVIALTPEQLCQAETMRLHIRRELLHIADMLEDHFGYRKEECGNSIAQDNLVRDRYRVLWDGYVEGRLLHEHRSTSAGMERLRQAFMRTFEIDDNETREFVFDRIVNGESLTHRDLWAWAGNTTALVTGALKDRKRRAVSADPCPLCRFPSYDWFRFEPNGDVEVVARLRSLFPNWSVNDGACRHCVDFSRAWPVKSPSYSEDADRVGIGDEAAESVVEVR